MMTTNQLLQHVIHQSASLQERLELGWVADTPDNYTVTRRLDRWQRVLSIADGADFARRLSWLGLDHASVQPLLGEGQLASLPTQSIETQSTPARATAWVDVLARLPERRRQALPLQDENLQDETSTGGPNDRLIKPFIIVAWERLAQSATPHLPLLSPQAKAHLTDYLVERLTALAQPTLTHLGLSAYLSPDLLDALCHSYPVLVRQLATAVAQWVTEITQFLDRFFVDWPMLAQKLGAPNQRQEGMIAAIRAGLSDPHYDGCTVWSVKFDTGRGPATAAMYKPKNLTQDYAWNHLLEWCNEQGLGMLGTRGTPLAHLWTLPFAYYGWMEWVQPQALNEVQDSLSAHRQLGMMLSLLTCLHASDLHEENVLWQAGVPLLIDAEMMPYPQIQGVALNDPLDVMRTGLLPRWQMQSSGCVEIGCLSSGVVRAEVDAVRDGYQDMNHFLRQHGSKLTTSQSLLKRFRQGKARFAPRPTAAYDRLLTHLRHPACLTNGIDFSIEADRLAATFLHTEQSARFWPLLAEEHRAIAQGDIPIFHADIGQPHLSTSGATIHNCFSWPTPQAPTVQDETVMVGLVQASLDHAPYLQHSSMQKRSLVDYAVLFGEQLIDRMMRNEQGAVTWAASSYQPRSGLYQHQLVDDGFYTGRAGIALFLSALSQATQNQAWHDLAQAAIEPFASKPMSTYADGGCLYAYSQLAQWQGESSNFMNSLCEVTTDRLNREALDPHNLKTSPQQMPQQGWGIIEGQAGWIVGWLRCWQQTALSTHLERAIAHGELLLVSIEQWPQDANGERCRLGGFSHGAAGIGYACTKLYEACGQARFLEAAKRFWTFQRSLYDAPLGLWQDRRSNPPVYLANWCHGAAGIGLAALGCLDRLPELQEVVDRSAAILMAQTTPLLLDTLCCGQFGQIETWLEIGQRLNRHEYVDHAADLAQTAVTKAVTCGYFQLYDDIPASLFNPTFFRGVAGIGYTLLRLAAVRGEIDAELPCLLGWGVAVL